MSEKSLQEIGKSAYESIEEMVTNLNQAREDEDDTAIEAAEQTIHEDPLSVRVRDGWRSPGAQSDGPDEYEILLSTGGPATRIVGELDDHCEPSTARLQSQDWYTTFETFHDADEEVLLAYCREFYFGD